MCVDDDERRRNARGLVLDRAIRNGTDNVVICRMRFRPTTWSAN
jgi:hypothetical protein